MVSVGFPFEPAETRTLRTPAEELLDQAGACHGSDVKSARRWRRELGTGEDGSWGSEPPNQVPRYWWENTNPGACARKKCCKAPCVKSWGVLQDLRIAKACELVGLVQTSRLYAQHIRNSGDNRTGGDKKWQPC